MSEIKIGDIISNVKDAFGSMMDFREDNPKVFYGGIGGTVFVVLLFMVMTPSGTDIEGPKITIGNVYTIAAPNGGPANLTSSPVFSSADYAGEDSVNVCQVKPGTKGKALESRFVTYIDYVRIEILDGECQGKKGWTSSVSLR